VAVMVTGGLGVIGSLVVRRLLEEGHTCVIFDNRATDTSLVADLLPRVSVEAGDITDLAHLLAIIRRHHVERVIHMAAVLDLLDHERPPLTMAANVHGTMNVFEAAHILGLKRVVFCSSRGVYREATGQHAHPTYAPIDENFPQIGPAPENSLYDATKQFAEHLATAYRKRYAIDFVGLRFASTFSYGKQARHGPGSIISRMVENAVDGIPTVISVGGDQKNDLIYSKDAASAVVLACFAADPASRFYHIGTGKASSLRDVAAAIRKEIPGAEIEVGPGLHYLGHGKRLYAVFDINRAHTELGYSPGFTLNEGVADYIATMRQLRQAARED